MSTQPPPPDAGAPPKKRGGCGKVLLIALAVIVGLGLLGLLFGGGDDAATDEPPAPEPTPAATESEPEAEPEGPTPEDIEAFVAEATGSGGTTYMDACTDGVGGTWMCDVEYAEPIGSTLEVRVRAISPNGPDGDRIARNFYNLLTMSEGSPMPDVSFVQVTTAQEGEVGSYRNW